MTFKGMLLMTAACVVRLDGWRKQKWCGWAAFCCRKKHKKVLGGHKSAKNIDGTRKDASKAQKVIE
jgi:hypothetical protein